MYKHTNNIKSLLKKMTITNLNYNKIKNDITNDLDINHLEQHYFLRKMIYLENIKLLTELDALEKYYKDNKTILNGMPIEDNKLDSRHAEKLSNLLDSRHAEKLSNLLDSRHAEKLSNLLDSRHAEKLSNKLDSRSAEELSNLLDSLIKEYDTYKENAIEHQQQLLDNNKLLLAEIDILSEKYNKIKEDYNSILSDFDKVKTDFNCKNVHLNSLIVQQSLEISKYKDKYNSLKIKSINTIKELCDSNNEKTDTINKLLTEQGEINC
jgi:hypothetical protein